MYTSHFPSLSTVYIYILLWLLWKDIFAQKLINPSMPASYQTLGMCSFSSPLFADQSAHSNLQRGQRMYIRKERWQGRTFKMHIELFVSTTTILSVC